MPVRVRRWLLDNLGTGDHLRAFNVRSTGADLTFALLTEDGDPLLTEEGTTLEVEHA